MASRPQKDQETALDMVKKGGTLLLLDVPQFTLVGIDTQVYSVGPNFKGIKMLPPGPHFVYYCSSNKDGNEFSPTLSFFIITYPSEVVVRKWYPQEERFVNVTEDEEEWFSEAVRRMEFDLQLGPYPLDHYAEWKQLSNYLSESIISRIEPIGGGITISQESALFGREPKTEMEKRLLEQLKSIKSSQPAAEKNEKRGCYYTTIPKNFKQSNITGEELTALNLDKSKLLDNVLMGSFGGEEGLILGELQFAFIAFMMGQSLEGFVQWKDLVCLFFSCTEAPLLTRSQLFTKFIRAVFFQLKHGFHQDHAKGNNVDKGTSLFLDDHWFSKDVFLYRLCKEFFPLVLDAEVVDGDLLLWTRKLKQLLETTFGWSFGDGSMDFNFEEDDEFAPVVVCLNEAGGTHDGQAT
ncbi:hypothetical protein AXF42_Ash018137 [Apostasia shenzhenica]|uniref:Uncharacterized protein n=1 Tax=Apostasia shenzhenica TaxID=1088818 RepID=A0A2I0AF05_9ASPA|nr:hypothetical protein AXF42_Ash018137 [Apostasia shenzhenica]